MAHDVKVEDDKVLEDLIKAGVPAFEKSIRKHVQPIVDSLQHTWPIDSGDSRRGFSIRYGMAAQNTPYAEVRNPVAYSADTRPKKGEPLSVNTLLYDPIRAAAEKVLDDVLEDLNRGRL